MNVPTLLKHKTTIIRGIWLTYGVAFGWFISSYFLEKWHASWTDFSHFSANIASLLLGLVLIPGIIKRLELGGIWRSIQIGLMPFRRMIGIGMYLFGYFHYGFQKMYPKLAYDYGSFVGQEFFELFGSLTLFIGLPLFLTSNNWAVRKLGRNWKRLHSLVYTMIWLLLAHLLFQGEVEPITVFLGIVAVAEVCSLVKSRVSKK